MHLPWPHTIKCAENINKQRTNTTITTITTTRSQLIELAQKVSECVYWLQFKWKIAWRSEWSGRSVWHIFAQVWPEVSHDICVRSSNSQKHFDSPKHMPFVHSLAGPHTAIQNNSNTAKQRRLIHTHMPMRCDAHIDEANYTAMFDTVYNHSVKNEYL